MYSIKPPGGLLSSTGRGPILTTEIKQLISEGNKIGLQIQSITSLLHLHTQVTWTKAYIYPYACYTYKATRLFAVEFNIGG